MRGQPPRRGRTALPLIAGSVAVVALTLPLSASATTGVAEVAPQVAPYMEMGAENPGNLSAGIDAGLSSVTAAFVVGRGCTPIWDTGVPVAKDTVASAAIAAAQARGVQVVVSFGGAGGTDLARSCRDAGRLTAAYQAVISRFGLTSIDFDVEGKAIDPRTQQESIARRFEAIRSLETQDGGLAVSATLGVGQSGLPKDQMSFLRKAKTSDTRVDLVNLMTMDYGGDVADMGAAAVEATRASLTQLQGLWPSTTYADLGITPMIGQNDSAGEVTTLADAATISAFAVDNGVGRLAYWSLNRDQQCGHVAAKARGGCSGVRQRPLQFTSTFLGGG